MRVSGAPDLNAGRLVSGLLEAGHDVQLVAQDPRPIEGPFDDAEIMEGDVSKGEAERQSGIVPASPRRADLTLASLAAGCVASLVMDFVQDAFDRSFERDRADDDRDEETEAIVSVVRLFAYGLPFLRPAGPSGIAGRVFHYVAGAALAAGYARVRQRHPRASVGGGLGLGFALWLASDVVLIPALRLGRPLLRYSAAERTNALVSHLAYGATVEQILRGVDRKQV
jgi:hypothetical protein